jgi:hypothetical protein
VLGWTRAGSGAGQKSKTQKAKIKEGGPRRHFQFLLFAF